MTVNLPKQPQRIANSIPPATSMVEVKSGFYPKIDTYDLFRLSLLRGKRVPVKQLRNLSRTIPVRKAIRRIQNGVLNMPWAIAAPELTTKKIPKKVQKQIKAIESALKRPNQEETNTYHKFIKTIINELITVGFAAVERQPNNDSSKSDRPFWLWNANGDILYINHEWSPDVEGTIAKYFFRSQFPDKIEYTPVFSENLFLITYDNSTTELIPPGPLEIAYMMISDYLGLSEFQRGTTTNAVREYMIVLKGVDDDAVDAFRQYWKADVQGRGEIPIVGGTGVDVNPFDIDVVKTGAANDEGLFLKYGEFLLRMIALAFDLSARDMNIVEPDNRATADVSADATFANAVQPMAIILKEALTHEIVDYYCQGYSFDFVQIESRSRLNEANIATNLYNSNIITLDEARARVDEDVLPEGGHLFASQFAARMAMQQNQLSPNQDNPNDLVDAKLDQLQQNLVSDLPNLIN